MRLARCALPTNTQVSLWYRRLPGTAPRETLRVGACARQPHAHRRPGTGPGEGVSRATCVPSRHQMAPAAGFDCTWGQGRSQSLGGWWRLSRIPGAERLRQGWLGFETAPKAQILTTATGLERDQWMIGFGWRSVVERRGRGAAPARSTPCKDDWKIWRIGERCGSVVPGSEGTCRGKSPLASRLESGRGRSGHPLSGRSELCRGAIEARIRRRKRRHGSLEARRVAQPPPRLLAVLPCILRALPVIERRRAHPSFCVGTIQ